MTRRYEELIVSIPDHPKPGVVFQDLMPAFADAEAFAAAIDDLAEHFAGRGITKIVGAEARGFIVAAALAYRLGAGFVAARKPGKLPRAHLSQTYELEYGTDSLEMEADALSGEDVVLIVDDLAATGGTAGAIAKMAQRCGATIAGFGFLAELAFLNPRAALAEVSDAEVFSLVPIA